MDTYRNPEDVRAARALAAALATILSAGIAGALLPGVEPTIIITAGLLVPAYVLVRVIAWRFRERRLDRADALAATAARAAYEARHRAAVSVSRAAFSDRGAA